MRPAIPIVRVDAQGLLHFVERIATRDAQKLVCNTPNLPLPFLVHEKELFTLEWPIRFERPSPIVFTGPTSGRGPLCQHHVRQPALEISVPMGGEWCLDRAEEIPWSRSRWQKNTTGWSLARAPTGGLRSRVEHVDASARGPRVVERARAAEDPQHVAVGEHVVARLCQRHAGAFGASARASPGERPSRSSDAMASKKASVSARSSGAIRRIAKPTWTST